MVRKILLILAGTAVIGTSGGASMMELPTQHARDLMAGILDDIGSILSSFAGGPNDPKSPVVNPNTLNTDSRRLDAATQKAEQLAIELGKLMPQNGERGH